MTTFITPRLCQHCSDRRAENRSDKLLCVSCGATRGRVSGRTTRFVEAIIKKFGPLDRPVRLRHQNEAAPCEQRREQRRRQIDADDT